MRALFRLLALSATVVTLGGACGARTMLGSGPEDGAAAPDANDAGSERSCPFDCTIGHQCCAGGCSGPAVSMPNDCCVCLPGETNSMLCVKDRCGS